MRNIELIFNNATPAPSLGYLIKYREVGTIPWQTLYPNPMNSPVVIPDLPSGKKWEGTIQAICSTTSVGGLKHWSVDDSIPAYIYLTNTGTTDKRGVKVWFSVNNYYASDNPAGLITANVYDTGELGIAPNINIPVKIWRSDISNTLDAGDGTTRIHDGERIINPLSDGLVFDIVTGSWRKALGIFPESIAESIAAFRIDLPLVETYTYDDVTYNLKVADSDTLIRVDNAFLAGATGVTFFDL